MKKTGKLEKLTKDLKKAAVVGGIIGSGLLYSGKANAQDPYTVNPFVQPNDTTLNWYGSGDANGDDTLTVADLTRMQDYIDGTFSDSNDNRLNDRMDVNGDEIVNQTDYNIMENHFQNRAPRDPEFYWANLSPEGKEAHLQRMLAIDKTNEAEWEGVIRGFDCDQYSFQSTLNFLGFPKKYLNILKEISKSEYTWEDNGRFNLPLLEFSTTEYNLQGNYLGRHRMNTIVLRNNILNWDDLCNIEPQKDLINIQPKEAYLIGDSTIVKIKGPPSRGPPEIPVLNLLMNHIEYEIKNEIPNGGIIDDDIYLYNINLITQKPFQNQQITHNIDADSIYEKSPIINVNVLDPAFKLAWARDSELVKKVLNKGENQLDFNLGEGNHDLMFYVKDIFDRDTVIKEELKIQDIYAPRINMNLNKEQADLLIDWSIDDPNFKSAEISIDGEPRQSIGQEGSINLPNLENKKYFVTTWALDFNNNERVLKDSIQITGVGLENKINQNNNLEVYPNPVSEDLTIKYQEGKNAIIDTWSVDGKHVSRIKDFDGNGETRSDFSSYASGMYIVRVTDDNGNLIVTRKVIKD
jgi:hypothetical protein